jgi:hypothetical protein
VRLPGVAVARAGGTAAAVLLAGSGVCTWVLAHVTDAATADAVGLLAAAAGGPAYVLMLGLLAVGLGRPLLRLGLEPRWLGGAAVALYALAVLASLALAVAAVEPLVPVVRYAGLAWLVAAAVTLPAREPSAPDAGLVDDR